MILNEFSYPDPSKTGTPLSAESLNRKVQSLERLLQISKKVSTLDLQAALKLITKSIIEMTQSKRGMLMLLEKNGELNFKFSINLDRQEIDSEEFAHSRSIVDRAIKEERVKILKNVPTSSSRDQPSFLILGLKACMAIPLKAKDKVLGVIYIDTDSSKHNMSEEDLSIFDAFGSQAAIALENAQLHNRLQEDYFFLKRSVEGTFKFDRIVYQSQEMHRVCESIKRVLENDITVLVLGETGTGKELVAQAIHYNGLRKDKRFVSQNAGAMPDTILESELFGHRRGAFSGAVETKVGLFEIADGGTVFLDEIGEASPALQVRLLRLLETGTFRRVGDTVNRKTNVRIIAATNRDLKKEVEEGRFRADLFYRLSVFPINLPALRERKDDIPVLVRHFVEEFNKLLNKSIRSIPQKVMDDLMTKDWKGNIRELRNFIYRMMVLSPTNDTVGTLDCFEDRQDEEPPEVVTQKPESIESLKTLAEMEREYITKVLSRVGGNQAKAARILDLNRSTFRWRLKKLGIGT